MSNKTVDGILEELEEHFHSFQNRFIKAKDSYIHKHSKEYEQARKKVNSAKKKLDTAKDRAAKATLNVKAKGTKTAHDQLEKAKAAMTIVGEAFGEAKDIMLTAESKLKSAKPFEKKLAARAKALAEFEKEWAKKEEEEEKKKIKQAAERKKKAVALKKAKAAAKKADVASEE